MALAGEVIFQRVFDLGGTLNLRKVRQILGPMAEAGAVQPTRALPEYVSFAAPIPLNLNELKMDLRTEDGAPAHLSARLYEVGVLAVTLRCPARGANLADLAAYNNAPVVLNGQSTRRLQVFTSVFDNLKPRLKPALDEIFDVPVEAESYTSFCLIEAGLPAEQLFREQRAQIAGLLIGEARPEKLFSGEIEDIVRNWHSYYSDDLTVTDWDAAFVVEPNGRYEDLLYIFEVANLQLLELRKYDLYLDNTLERGYDEFERLSKGPPIFTSQARAMVRELSEVRMDLAEVTDEIANTAKFFGDWYIARVYLGLAQKLHIGDYHRSVEEKLATLNDLYQSVLSEIDRRQNILLELLIIILIVIEVLLALIKGP
jgi:hypothetical protein